MLLVWDSSGEEREYRSGGSTVSAIIDVQGVSKSYGGVLANADVSMRVEKGRHHRFDRS